PAIPSRSKESRALRIQIAIVRASLRHGITTDSSGSFATAAGAGAVELTATSSGALTAAFTRLSLERISRDRNVLIRGRPESFPFSKQAQPKSPCHETRLK